MSVDGSVTLRIEGGVALLTLSRHRRHNALDLSMWRQLAEKVEEARAAAPRALVIVGDGPHFCAGMDLKPDNPVAQRALAAILEADAAAARGIIEELKGYLEGLSTFPAPTIAAIEGVCVGGGYELALCCDVLLAADDARVGLPEVRIGMIPDLGGTTRLARRVGTGRAILLICGGQTFSGAEALSLGLVDRLVPHGSALTAARELATEIGRGGPKAVSLSLSLLRAGNSAPLAEALQAETAAGVAALISGEPIEGLGAFAEKRAPVWS